MRCLLVALGVIASLSNASAADYPTLRGTTTFEPDTPTYFNWSGFYAGGQVGYGNSAMDFSGATQSLVEFSLRELALENISNPPSTWQVLGKSNTKSATAGGFVGYNTRFDDVVLGLDFSYNRTSFFATAPVSPISRVTSANGLIYLVNLTGDATLRITDVAVMRARAGYAVENWLFYATIGFAVARADYTRTATVSGTETVPNSNPLIVTPFSFTEGDGQSGVFMYGGALGGGIDVMVLPQVFLRAEYEYVTFTKIGDIKSSTSTGRLGAGFKF